MSRAGLPVHTMVDDFLAPVCEQFLVILYQDDDILLINKPSGLLSLSGKNPLNWDSVHYRLVHGQEGGESCIPGGESSASIRFWHIGRDGGGSECRVGATPQ